MIEGKGPVLVTGTSSGIGRAIAELLSSNGHEVLATARKKADLATLARLPHVTPILLDVTHEGDVQKAVKVIRDYGRGLYGLVNNAGIVDLAPLLDSSVERLQYLLDVNLYGIHRMVRACFPFLTESHGRIVNIGSINGIIPEAFAGAYCISKFAVEAYTDVLRQELSALGIHLSVVEPGEFRSDIASNFVTLRGDTFASASSKSPYRDAIQKEMEQITGSPGELDRSKYPAPRPVAEAVLDALFSEKPKPRYLVGSQEETDATVDRVLRLLSQLNQRHEHTLTKEQLVDRLRKVVR